MWRVDGLAHRTQRPVTHVAAGEVDGGGELEVADASGCRRACAPVSSACAGVSCEPSAHAALKAVGLARGGKDGVRLLGKGELERSGSLANQRRSFDEARVLPLRNARSLGHGAMRHQQGAAQQARRNAKHARERAAVGSGSGRRKFVWIHADFTGVRVT